jgi:hypothetical protein
MTCLRNFKKFFFFFFFLNYFPDARHRLDVCPDRQYTERSFCFYEYEWPCGGRCIPKSEVCDQTDRGGCDAGMKRCGKDRCVARNTPCNGKCWSETALNICGTNMCLSKYQLEVKIRAKLCWLLYEIMFRRSTYAQMHLTTLWLNSKFACY